jgi:two-component system OmpR family sensor kinase
MNAEQLAQVFERFYRADPSRARSSGGAGLGLAIVAAVVEAHGGAVDAESVPGGGTLFRVRLPLAQS